MSKIGFLNHIKSLDEGKYIFSSLILGLFLIIFVFLLDFHTRHHLYDLETRSRDLERRLGELQNEVMELRSERERREVVLRKEIGKAREEVVGLEKEFEVYRTKVEKEREVDRNVDMEEKLCIIRGLREIAGDRGVDIESHGGGEKLIGLGISLGNVGSDEDLSVTSSSSEDEAKTAQLRKETDEAWERFEQAFMRNNGERGLEDGSPFDQHDQTNDRHDPSSEVLLDIYEEVSLEDSTGLSGTQGERLFPATPKEFPLVNRRTDEVPTLADLEVQVQIDDLFELAA